MEVEQREGQLKSPKTSNAYMSVMKTVAKTSNYIWVDFFMTSVFRAMFKTFFVIKTIRILILTGLTTSYKKMDPYFKRFLLSKQLQTHTVHKTLSFQNTQTAGNKLTVAQSHAKNKNCCVL